MAASSASSLSSFSARISTSPFRPTSLSSPSFARFHPRLKTKLWSHAVSSSPSSSFNLSVKANIDDVPSQSTLIASMTDKIKEQLNTDNVVVKDAQGDGRHVSIEVVSSEFEGKSSMNRQRMVYKAIWEELQSVVHAVDSMRTLTPEEFEQGK